METPPLHQRQCSPDCLVTDVDLVWAWPHYSTICDVVRRPGSSSCGEAAVQPAAGAHGALLPPPAALPGRAAQHLSRLGGPELFDSVVLLGRRWGAPADESRPDEADAGQQRETRRERSVIAALLLNPPPQHRVCGKEERHRRSFSPALVRLYKQVCFL